MSRARNIKPGFFKNELLVELPFEYRLLFVGLWTMADRDGRLEDRPTKIRMEVFPADTVDVNAGLQALHDQGFILRYAIEGKAFIQILAWGKHQNPHVKEAKSTIPAPGEHGASTVQAPAKADTSPADSLIPDSLIPDSLKELPLPDGRVVPGKPATHDCPHAEIVAAYHEILPELRRVRDWTQDRQKFLRGRWREKAERQSVEWWRGFFRYVRGCPFLMGQAEPTPGRDPFEADLEWLVRPTNFRKVIEGKFQPKRARAA